MTPVIWFLGLSGSGKTTISKKCFELLKTQSEFFPDVKKWEILDGDTIRDFLGSEFGYEFQERRKSVRVMGLLAKTLSKNGIGVIVANISPFHDLRVLFKKEIACYYEIYCKCSIEECIRRDPKGLYKNQFNEGIRNYIGLDIPFQEPLAPDLILDTEMSSLENSFDDVVNFLHLKQEILK
jgi:adenylylsulfate kinase